MEKKTNENISVPDWLSFLESRTTSTINIVVAGISLIVAVGAMLISLLVLLIKGEIEWMFLAIIIAVVVFHTLLVILYGFMHFGTPQAEVLAARILIEEILSGDITNPRDIKKKWDNRFKDEKENAERLQGMIRNLKNLK